MSNFDSANALQITLDTTIPRIDYGSIVSGPNNVLYLHLRSDDGVNLLSDPRVIVDWGDGNTETITITQVNYTTVSHTYTTDNTYTVKVYGNLSHFNTGRDAYN